MKSMDKMKIADKILALSDPVASTFMGTAGRPKGALGSSGKTITTMDANGTVVPKPHLVGRHYYCTKPTLIINSLFYHINHMSLLPVRLLLLPKWQLTIGT
ncbi:hypothetical protein [uncultured Desulfosarcina sp.]|uniref:hypothetical protein n=1 Tax=uncultured Desulfosarcina sp. TaxID=218289 RepID=UPI0029C6185E|nr:hypothetical protein [uncultured Desulfosarcina sp.]